MSVLIKWTGSKESQAQNIISNFPSGEIDTYWEPFVGGGAVFLNLILESSNIISSIRRFYISDTNKELIGIWKLIKDDPDKLCSSYSNHHKNYNLTLGIEYASCAHRQNYFKKIRNQFNVDRRPEDLFFLIRTSVNGLIRYNRKGNFNSACHFNRPGMSVKEVQDAIYHYSTYFNRASVEIHHHPYECITPNKNDVVYLDPPYENTVGMYGGGFDNKKFLAWLDSLVNTRWFLSYDGTTDGKESKHAEPKTYRKKVMLNFGESQFRKVLNDKAGVSIVESLYVGGLGDDSPLTPLSW